MKRILRFPLYILFLLLTVQCHKEECDHAMVSVKNTGTDTIYYSWGSNFYTDTLPPGKTIYDTLGSLNHSRTLFMISEDKYVVYFNTSKGDFAWDVESCFQEFTVD